MCVTYCQAEDRELPDCETACCGGWQPGSWVNSTSDSAAKHYRADENEASCQYFDYRRAEVTTTFIACIKAHGCCVKLHDATLFSYMINCATGRFRPNCSKVMDCE